MGARLSRDVRDRQAAARVATVCLRRATPPQRFHGSQTQRVIRHLRLTTSKHSTTAAVASLVLLLSGCKQGQSGSADSAYTARLNAWLRDSSVLDSITRTVSTDSLYRVYRRALEPAGTTRELVQQMYCQEVGLRARHGPIPAERAIKAMLDTVYRDLGTHDAYRTFMSGASASGSVDSRPCSGRANPVVKVGDTRLDLELPRPRSR